MVILVFGVEDDFPKHFGYATRDGDLMTSKFDMTMEVIGYKDGPGNRRSLSDNPFDDLALASNIMRSFVVLDDDLNTPCIGR